MAKCTEGWREQIYLAVPVRQRYTDRRRVAAIIPVDHQLNFARYLLRHWGRRRRRVRRVRSDD
jgi:hypothetical protein